MSKICSKCGEEKTYSEFYKGSGNRCKICHNTDCVNRNKLVPEKNRERAKRWYHKQPENGRKSIVKALEWQRKNKERDSLNKFKYNLKRNYGLSYEDYCKKAEEQKGLCAICFKPPYRNLDVDHNHSTGKNRGLLCGNCNTAIGLLKEDPQLFTQALAYLMLHQTSN